MNTNNYLFTNYPFIPAKNYILTNENGNKFIIFQTNSSKNWVNIPYFENVLNKCYIKTLSTNAVYIRYIIKKNDNDYVFSRQTIPKAEPMGETDYSGVPILINRDNLDGTPIYDVRNITMQFQQ